MYCDNSLCARLPVVVDNGRGSAQMRTVPRETVGVSFSSGEVNTSGYLTPIGPNAKRCDFPMASVVEMVVIYREQQITPFSKDSFLPMDPIGVKSNSSRIKRRHYINGSVHAFMDVVFIVYSL
jgi:hypothetical protein